MPLVSVIIPNYNHSKFLRKRIDSILYQTFRDFELIILDDASTDNSREIILEYAKQHPGIITCFNEQNSGNPFKQWNKGVSLSHGDYLWIAESDDFAEPEFLARSLAEIAKSDSIGLVCCNTWIRDEQKHLKYRLSDKLKHAGFAVKTLTLKSFARNPIPNVSSVVFRKSAYRDAGGADESMQFCGDWSLYVNLIKRSEIKYISETLNTFRLHETSSYHKYYTDNTFLKEKLSVLKILVGESHFSPSIVIPVIKDLLISFVLRIIFYLKLPSFLVPRVPRTPLRFEHI